MKIQVNSDKTIAVDASLTRFVEGEVTRVLARFAPKVTRVEIHLSDVDNRKTGQADKRCLVEVRPASAQPLSVSANATKLASAVREALRKMRRSLTTFFGRTGRSAAAASAPVSMTKETGAKKAVGKKTVVRTTPDTSKKSAGVKKAAVKKPTELSSRGPKKKAIYQARRKSWPAR